MKYYSLFYNACQARLFGGSGSGFGVRTVTEGTPKEVVAELSNYMLYSYSAGSFDTHFNAVDPKKINMYPCKYVFHRLGQTDYYLMARTAYIGYDIDFYLSGKPCRGGNYVVNLYAFEGWPGKKVFSLLQDSSSSECLQFLPLDRTPSLDNAELKALIVGKPQFLPVENKSLAELSVSVPGESIDAYFSYLEARGKNQPLVVRTKAADAERIAAGFMCLLPEDVAQMTPFILNYQEEGIFQGFAVAFINEYYQHELSPISCTIADLVSGSRKILPLESMWRDDVEKEIAAGGLSKEMSSWIYSQTALRSVSLSKEINEVLYRYCFHPELFAINMIETPGFLDVLTDESFKSCLDAKLLNGLLADEIENASDFSKVEAAISHAGRLSSRGLLAETSKNAMKTRLAFFANSSVEVLSNLFRKVDKSVLDQYLSKSDFPPVGDIASKCILNDIVNTRDIITYLEHSPKNRVRLFVEIAKNHPEKIAACRKNMCGDSEEAAGIDYLAEFRNYYSNEDFAEIFFGQLTTELHSDSAMPRKLISEFKMLADANPAFARMLFSDSRIYESLYRLFEPICKEGNAADISLISDGVLDVIPEDCASRKKWTLLLNVLDGKTEDVNAIDYYNLALKIKAENAFRLIAPYCFDKFGHVQIAEFIENLKSVFDEEQIIEKAKGQNLSKSYLVAIARTYCYDFHKIESLAPEFGLSEKDFSQFMKTNFSSIWKKHKIKKFFSNLFLRKDKKMTENRKRRCRKTKENKNA